VHYLIIIDVAGTTNDHTAGTVPEVGRVIADLTTRKAWRVLDVSDVHQTNWDKQTLAAWRTAGEPPWETWKGRERRVLGEPARNPAPSGKDRRGLRICPWATNELWRYLEEPWPECTRCGRLWPCPCYDANRAAEQAMEEVERVAGILPGCCWACGEPITGRQHSIVFEGENLLMPGAGPAAFHTSASRKAARGPSGNQTCRSEAERYEEQWVAAGEGRTVRLRCPGAMWSHFGYRECTNPDCPGEQASHSDWGHCVTSCHESWYEDGEWRTRARSPVTNCGELGCKGPKAAGATVQIQADGER
jgi:hypothetical protein